jgi:hypothetical protein
MTADEIRGFDGRNEPTSNLRNKIKWARDECVSAAIKSRNAGKNPFDQFDKDEWEEVPNRQ